MSPFVTEFFERTGGHPNDCTDCQLMNEEEIILEGGDTAFASQIRNFRERREAAFDAEFKARTGGAA